MVRWKRFPTLVALAMAALLFGSVRVWTLHADPSVADNRNGTMTASWDFGNPANYSATGAVRLEPQRLSLSTTAGSAAIYGASSLSRNGTTDGNLTSKGEWLRLKGHESSWVPNGNFSVPGPWTYLGGPGGRLFSGWSSGHGRFNHSASPTWRFYESMDAPSPLSWIGFATGGSLSSWSKDSVDRIQGTASMRDNVTLILGGYAGVYNSTTVPWNVSSFDRIAGWFKATQAGLNLSLILTTAGGARTVGTVAVPTAWTELAFGITSLGTNRSSVTRFELRFSGAVGFFSVHIDSIRLVSQKDFTESAVISQSLAKTWVSSPARGSSTLTCEVALVTLANIAAAEAKFTIASGATLLFERRLALNATGSYPLVFDVSSAVAATGLHNLSVTFGLQVNSSLQTDAELWVDNVTLLSPAFHGGRYTTTAIDAGSAVRWGTLNWTAVMPQETAVTVWSRTGSTPNPADGTWNSWVAHSNAGGGPVGSPPDRYVQVAVDLGTTNESRTPAFYGFAISNSRYGQQGAIETWPFRPGIGLISWNRFDADLDEPPSTSTRFLIAGADPWREIKIGENLTGLSLGSLIQLRVELSTTNTSQSPTVKALRVEYLWRGPLSVVRMFPASVQVSIRDNVTFNVTGHDAYGHAAPFAPVWSTTDPNGTIVKQRAGWVYTPGSVGTWRVYANSTDGRFSASATVTVYLLDSPAGAWVPWYVIVLGMAAVVAAALAGFLVWEQKFRFRRRMEDLFLIGKDGRLLLHNTLQLHPDRDEDVLAGMLTAILSFVRDAFRDSGGYGSDLKTFRIGDAKVLVERGEHLYAAAIFRTMEPPWAPKDLSAFVRDVETAYAAVLRSWSGDPSDLRGLRAMTDEFVRRRRYHNHHRSVALRPTT